MRRWIKVLLGVLAAVAALLAIVTFGVPALIETSWATGRVKAAIETASGRRTEIGSIEVSWIDGLEIKNLVIHQKESRDQRRGPLLRVPELEIKVGLLDLLRHNLEIESIVATEPSIVLVRDAAGTFNIDDLIGRPDERRRELTARFQISGGRLLFADNKTGRSIEAENVELDGEVRGKQISFESELEVNDGEGLVRGSADLSRTPVSFRIEEARLIGAKIETTAPGLELLLPLLGEDAKRLGGTLDLKISELRGRGLDARSLRRSLAGRGDIAIEGGTLISGPVLRIYDALVAERTLAGIAGALGFGGRPRAEMLGFEVISSSFVIGGGRVSSDDLRVSSPRLELVMTGATRFDGSLDWTVTAPEEPKLHGVKFLLRGTIADPRVSIDAGGAIQEKARDVLQERAGQLFDRILKGVPPAM